MASRVQGVDRSITVDGVVIAYTLQRKAMKCVRLRIDLAGKVYVSAPYGVALSFIEDFLKCNAKSIVDAQQRCTQQGEQAPRAHSYEAGEIFYILGEPYKLRVQPHSENGAFHEAGVLNMCIKEPSNYALRRAIVRDYLGFVAQLTFPDILRSALGRLQAYGVPYPHLELRWMRSRWGTCQYKNAKIIINKALIAAPSKCIEYVILHELCHFVHPNHGSEFQALLKLLMPEAEECRQVLRSNQYARTEY